LRGNDIIFMDKETVNPFIMVGSYAGLLLGILLSLKGWHIFWWLPPLVGLQIDDQIFLDAVGGFFAGYVLHLLIRVYRGDDHNNSMKVDENKK